MDLKEAEKVNNKFKADRVEIVFYTDPLCCWSWALYPHLSTLRNLFKDNINLSYCMSGLIPDWNSYNDPMNTVSRPAQMGPIWMEAQHISGAAINPQIWIQNPPSSSYPACIAVKAAGLQSSEIEEAYLVKLWEAVMTDAKDISKPEVLIEVAQQTAENTGLDFNIARFSTDLSAEDSLELFRNDLKRVRYNRIGRFPTITMSKEDGRGIILTGYRPYEVLSAAFSNLFNNSEN
ncbi:DsbA family protein [Rubrolithibacter danxiaensis]|uniref:DsbA family protein n=1 Tax=Rubrolithibacter danxiaensis TaxID=3390805 RepID=UPI003BF82100